MWDSFWDFIWYTVVIFIFVAYLMMLFWIISDLFRDRALSGWWKAVWMVFLIFIPWLTALVYLIARGPGMSQRAAETQSQMQQQSDAYIRSVAGKSSADQIADAKALLDAGTIDQQEFEALKAKALS
ncbi:SHOCT domain-containing protein [Gordonia sp. Z-3]|jgi:ABC-type multidrug transport system fused ATPase/permease subunit|uniref:SHOCT domain-containing protein n=2 Tax=Gordonia TaxID=2053 RepID=A0A9X3D8D3_9ACTN|nr:MULTISPECIES: SHOCT domain-containing protein [Gordonia]MCF3937099.1 SHOCT domain-containing protein [Gordonia tangerina]MCX2966602.1 SHOCT domain-containing protein [Gordonia aquimaris]MED5802903.1 SHOCT domain-containing protein [Gordonia sp. Z-3]